MGWLHALGTEFIVQLRKLIAHAMHCLQSTINPLLNYSDGLIVIEFTDII